MYEKVILDVIVKQTKEGKSIPLAIFWEDGRKFEIDRVFEMKKAASLKVGGYGFRYKCRIKNQIIFLWFDNIVWFTGLCSNGTKTCVKTSFTNLYY